MKKNSLKTEQYKDMRAHLSVNQRMRSASRLAEVLHASECN